MCGFLVPAAGAVAGPGDVPRGFIRHHESPYWTWFGPADWVGAYGAYGITVTSPSGLDALDYGFSTVPCASSPAAFFRQRRVQLRGSISLQGLRFFNVGAVRARGGGTFRQTLQFAGASNGTAMRGELTLAYALTSPPYCYGSTLARYAPTARYATSIFVLRKIWQYTYYSGPGACHSTDDDPPCA
jgi:hypothetical protein